MSTIGPGELAISAGGWFYAYISADHVGYADTRALRLCPARQPEVSAREIESYLVDDDWYEPDESADVKTVHAQWNLLCIAAQEMRALGHGGAILSVEDDGWLASVKHPNPLAFSPNTQLKDSVSKVIAVPHDKVGNHWDAIHERERQLSSFVRLTAIDGALVLHRDLTALAIGARIQVSDALGGPEKVVEMTVFEGSVPRQMKLLEIGGMRHVSAAQFVHANRSSVAFVAPQDGPLSVVRWSNEHECVMIIRRAEVILRRIRK